MSRRFAGAGLVRRDARSPVGVADPGPQSPAEIIADAKIVDWFRADLDVSDGGAGAGVVDSWTGQKRGIVITAPAATNRCVLTAANANFNGQPTVNASGSGGNDYLSVTGLATPIWTTTDRPYALAVMRSANAWDTTGFDDMLVFRGATQVYVFLFYVPAGDTVRRRILRNGGVALDTSISVDVTTPALWRAGLDSTDGTSGNLFAHNDTVSAATGTGFTLFENVTGMTLGAHSAGDDRGAVECAEIVLLNVPPSAGELAAYSAYTAARYGVP